MTAVTIGRILGGLGLLLLGMNLMTEGLTLAAGRALQSILSRWTSTRWRGLLSGVAITGITQSSSAVTVATIGFANAGLLTLSQAAWVVYGTNVGTTVTAWLVALVGLKVRIESFALPIIGVGMILRLARPEARLGHAGRAFAGFGVLMLGLGLLKDALSGMDAELTWEFLAAPGITGALAGLVVGVLLTVVMQSSSGAMAVILTAAAGGIVGLHVAAAMVVGSNMGTTSTALLTTLGATSNARRVAVLHVIFNLLTGVTAFALLVPLVAGLEAGRRALGMEADAPAVLALFHTAFNVLGVLLMWPLSERVIRVLSRRFTSSEEEESRPRHLDASVLRIPELGMQALRLEEARAGKLALECLRDVWKPGAERRRGRVDSVRRLLVVIGEHAAQLNRAALSAEVAHELVPFLRVNQRYLTLVQLSQEAVAELEQLPPADPARAIVDAPYREATERFLAAADPSHPDASAVGAALEAQQAEHDRLQDAVLHASAAGCVSVESADRLTRALSHVHRACNQAARAAREFAVHPGSDAASASAAA